MKKTINIVFGILVAVVSIVSGVLLIKSDPAPAVFITFTGCLAGGIIIGKELA